MAMPQTAEQREARTQAVKRNAFERFLEQPMVTLALASIPPTDPPETLRTLLQAAFDAGFGSGQGDIIMDVVMMVVEGKKKE